MKNSRKLLFVAIMLLFTISLSKAQDAIWQVILHSGGTLNACMLDSLHGDVLSVTCSSGAYSFPVDSIVAFERPKEKHFWKAAGTGSMIGGGVGFVVGAVTYPKQTGARDPNWDFGGLDNLGASLAAFGGALAGALGGLVVGGVIEASSSNTETYDLKEKTPGFKLAIIRRLLSQ